MGSSRTVVSLSGCDGGTRHRQTAVFTVGGVVPEEEAKPRLVQRVNGEQPVAVSAVLGGQTPGVVVELTDFDSGRPACDLRFFISNKLLRDVTPVVDGSDLVEKLCYIDKRPACLNELS